MQVFTPPDPNDLTTSTQKYFTGAIEYMASVMYDKCRVNNLRRSGCRNETHLRCTQGDKKVTKFKLLFRNKPER